MVSVCIPAYNARSFLLQALESVRAQSHADWELIVVEDGSDDGTRELVANFAASVPQAVRYERHAANKGLPATRNTGITQAKGEYIALLDADDYWAVDHLSDLLDKIAKTGAELAHSGSILFDSESGNAMEIRAPSEDSLKSFPQSLFVASYIIQPSSVVIAKALWARVGGFNESFRYVEDREMWLRCARAGARFAFSGTNTCFYRKHAAALSTHAAEMAIASARVLEQHLDWAEIPQQLRVCLTEDTWVSAARLLQRAEPARATELLRNAQRISPRWYRPLWSSALQLYSLVKRNRTGL